jgi:signal transduction histidine kinase
VTVDCRHDELGIEVTDDGRGSAPPAEGPGEGSAIEGGAIEGGGFGIDGMRERACLLGGELTAGPRAGGGFRVAARLPVPAAAR